MYCWIIIPVTIKINPIIVENKRVALIKALNEVFPKDCNFGEIEIAGREPVEKLFECSKGQDVLGYVVLGSSTGFQSHIKIMCFW